MGISTAKNGQQKAAPSEKVFRLEQWVVHHTYSHLNLWILWTTPKVLDHQRVGW